MKITFNTDPVIEFEINENSTEEDIGSLLAANATAKSYALNIARESGFQRYYSDGYTSFNDSTLRELVNAFFKIDEEGFDGIDEILEGDDSYHFQDYVRKPIIEELSNLIDDEAEGSVVDLDIAEGIKHFLDEIEDELRDAMYEKDDSTLADAVPSHEKVELSFIPNANVLSFDDLQTDHLDVCSDSESIYPDANFMRALQFFNISPSEFIAAAKERDIDLLNPSTEGLSELRVADKLRVARYWAAIVDLEAGKMNSQNLPIMNEYETRAWNETAEVVRYVKDHDRPAALSMDNLFTILNEASYGGTPAFVCRFPVRDILEGALDKPFLAKGGFIGIHNFTNGSGYIETPEAAVLIDPSKGRWATKFGSHTVDDVYGIVPSYYNVETSAYVPPEFQRVRENMWLSQPDEKVAAITRTEASDGTTEFWVQTFDKEMNEAGPRATAEVFTSFEDARDHAKELLSEEWTTAPKL